MDDPAENAPSILEWELRIDVVGGSAANRVAPDLESTRGGATGDGGDSDDDCSAAATHTFKGMPTEELAMRKKMAIGELASQKRKEGVANTRQRISSARRPHSTAMDPGTRWAQQSEEPTRRQRKLGITTTR